MEPTAHAARMAQLREDTRKVGSQRALEDLWIDDAYEAERSGNFQKYNYIMGWVARVPKLLQGDRS